MASSTKMLSTGAMQYGNLSRPRLQPNLNLDRLSLVPRTKIGDFCPSGGREICRRLPVTRPRNDPENIGRRCYHSIVSLGPCQTGRAITKTLPFGRMGGSWHVKNRSVKHGLRPFGNSWCSQCSAVLNAPYWGHHSAIRGDVMQYMRYMRGELTMTRQLGSI